MSTQDWFFLTLSLIWLLEFILFKGQRQSGQSSSSEHKSYYLILLAILATVIACLSIRESGLVTSRSLFFLWFAMFIYGIGIFLRYWSMLTLKHDFTRHVHVSAAKNLVSHGPYRLLRHPLYSALLICMVGLSCFLASWLGVAVTALFVLPALLIRIRLEESMLSNALGATYDTWKMQRWILVPWIY